MMLTSALLCSCSTIAATAAFCLAGLAVQRLVQQPPLSQYLHSGTARLTMQHHTPDLLQGCWMPAMWSHS